MRRLMAAALAATVALGAGGGPALADEATGTIKTVDFDRHQVTLENDTVYMFPTTTKLQEFAAGDRVTIEYTVAEGKNTATSIQADEEM